ncbi:beta-ketoacyl-ACP synthase II [Epidermidibacterium keratini]|uniref:Beta-ketoacyl-ACP synthase II n=1 Tax=Epidermidibacterium keratini TaxID=1891644 RepID=A0A7L4YJJ7_9ACTN|nr:beta-ketoacyl-[acyl-carrier-protein] synthase family protein [Epidermidibacterium keratini]QHB99415.1 beta-ketoacyl-ACP synthase II [Epidermidibacterium keratini]
MQDSRGGRRVVITGLGVLAPHGTGLDAFWEGLGVLAETERERKVADFDPKEYGLKHTDARRLDRFAQLGYAAAKMAVDDAFGDAGLEQYDAWRRGVVMGTGIGGAYAWEGNAAVLGEKGEKGVSPLVVPMVMPNAASAAISMRLGMRGPVETVTTACASGTHAIGNGAKLIAAGRSDVVLAGGSEACQTGVMRGGFDNMKATSPSGISRPFDVQRDGFCSAEAGGVLVLEEYEAAKARGATIYAEVVGAGSTADAHHITAPDPDGDGALHCMKFALEDAGLSLSDITQINAHGTSTPLNDAAESAAVTRLFGDHRPAMTSIKGVTGHSLGAAGAIEGIALALSFKHGKIPPTMATTEVDPKIDADIVLEWRDWEPAPALSNSFAFGGHNGSVIFAPVD